jgi:hypothetical protein
MSLSTYPVDCTVKGYDAQIVVIRTNGYCYASVFFPDFGQDFDIYGERDVYDLSDEAATRYFINVARRTLQLAPKGQA